MLEVKCNHNKLVKYQLLIFLFYYRKQIIYFSLSLFRKMQLLIKLKMQQCHDKAMKRPRYCFVETNHQSFRDVSFRLMRSRCLKKIIMKKKGYIKIQVEMHAKSMIFKKPYGAHANRIN